MQSFSMLIRVGLFVIIGATSAVGSSSFAATRSEVIKSTFNSINRAEKGALGANSYQRPNGRMSVIQNGAVVGPPRDTVFTAAFRSDLARQLAAQDFYVGNRFSTIYWELHTKYLASDSERKALAFKLDHARFLASPQIANDARSVARHMLLEHFFVRKFPESRIARANTQRGTADAEHEEIFYRRFVEYLGTNMVSNSDYLNVYEVQKRWNLTGDAKEVSLSKLRDQVAWIYDRWEQAGLDAGLVAEFKGIRNSIHNYLTPSVLVNLNAFLRRYGSQLGANERSLATTLRDQLTSYYRTDKRTLLTWASKLAGVLPTDATQTISSLSDGQARLNELEALSQLMVHAKESYFNARNPDVLHFLIRVNQYIQSQLGSRDIDVNDWSIRARIALDASLATGVITSETWFLARKPLETVPASSDVSSIQARVNDFTLVFADSQKLIKETMSPAISDWMVVERTMEGFIDDTLRSSPLSELDLLTTLLKKQLPKSDAGYTIETQGEAYGYLVYLPKGAPASEYEKLDKTMIPIFAELPLDLGVVAGIITELPQTPLSHVNIKSKARGTPNVYFPNASQNSLFKELAAQRALVKISLANGKVSIRPASVEEAQEFWKKMRAPVKVDVRADLTETRIRSTRELRVKDVLTVGAKAANYGECHQVLALEVMREALAIPFSYYKNFIDSNMYDQTQTIAQKIVALTNDPRLQTDREYLVSELKLLQARMTADEMVVDPVLIRTLQERTNQLYPGRNMRFRSSTNSEDLPNFSGAGLYDSFTYNPKKPQKSIDITLKKVWASVWTLRAFDERELFGINHQAVYMGVLVSPSYPDELANGVAITRNTIDAKLGKGLYINTQVGEELVTNPDPEIFPEELLVLDQPDRKAGLPYTLKYLRYSKLMPSRPIMTNDEAVSLSKHLVKLNNHFRKIHDPKNRNATFAMDAEFKIDVVNGQRGVFIKQARPYVTR